MPQEIRCPDERLRGMLKAVQDLKSQYYIGTKEGYDVIKKVQRVYSNPGEISDIINKKLQAFSPLTYPATPERVVGLEKVISDISHEIYEEHDGYPEKYLSPELYLGDNFKEFSIFDIESSVFHQKPEKMAQVYSSFFAGANSDFISLDDEFGAEVVKVINKNYQEIRNRIKQEEILSCDEYINSLTENLAVINWKEALSERVLREEEKLHANASFSDISTGVMLDRMLRDRVDHRLEYRRAILCNWLGSYSESYEEAVSFIERRIKERSRRLNIFIQNSYPDCIIEDTKKSLRDARFIRHLLGSDRNFVRRYLQH